LWSRSVTNLLGGIQSLGGSRLRVVVVGREANDAAVKLRPFQTALTRFGLEPVFIPEAESLRFLGTGPMVIVVPIEVAGYETLTAVRCRCRDAVIVASVERLTRGVVALALDYGAQSVVSWEESPDCAVETVWAATRGFVRQSVLALLWPATGTSGLSDEERQWLILLEAGLTIPAVAREVHRSPSDLKRRLRALYDRIQAAGVRDALVMAHQRGWMG
jgi:DNA-binding NarL/FixJ family response regulator